MSDPAKTLYFPTWISPGRKTGWSWGTACDTATEAARAIKDQLVLGATLGVIVKFANGEKTPLANAVYPMSARKIVAHWEDLWERTE